MRRILSLCFLLLVAILVPGTASAASKHAKSRVDEPLMTKKPVVQTTLQARANDPPSPHKAQHPPMPGPISVPEKRTKPDENHNECRTQDSVGKKLDRRGNCFSQPRKAARYSCPEYWADVVRDGFIQLPRQNEALFYANVGSTAAVRRVAKKHGKVILVDILKSDYKRWCLNRCERDRFWRHSSRAFAKTASGDVHVLLNDPDPAMGMSGVVTFDPKLGGPGAGQRTIWDEVEEPALRENRRVTRVLRSKMNRPIDHSWILPPAAGGQAKSMLRRPSAARGARGRTPVQSIPLQQLARPQSLYGQGARIIEGQPATVIDVAPVSRGRSQSRRKQF